jgi:putative NIF3 family GTP cyclohydrolase 1 type 2
MPSFYPLGQLSRRLDDEFDVARFDEADGWDFGLTPAEKAALLERASANFRATFNGLSLADETDTRPVGRVYLLVFPTHELVEQVLTEQASYGQPALLLTHHALAMRMHGHAVAAIPIEQLDALRRAEVALYVIHAPLDCHLTISTSGAIADGLGLQRVGVFAPYVAGYAGVLGEQRPEPFDAFAERVRVVCELPHLLPSQIRHAGRPVERVAILAGGGDDLEVLGEAEALGADTYVSGQWWTPHDGEWADANRRALRAAIAGSRMNLLGCSHDGSELVVFRDALAPLLESWGLETRLLRQEDHWR